ncbi:cell division protein FtsB [Thiohalophilus thiocyanatoxydans]|uniref:Cell division protein FtsB n=1 Tax=Thiohalophilus thiocyanatoxydans TaxID=381308 RepID=A0A4R8IHN6_9GAMM|nr:cell division protein FtsB [Thiohalophilus thiocyanatoxydans]TDY00136.1 cell division protein FtsB [Thiohalophilus thiocyanatoxydans]
MRILIAILLILFVTLQYDLWVGDGSLATVWHLKQEVKKQKAENRKLEVRNRALEAEVEDLKQGLDALEERARDEMGMIKEGETFIQIIEEEEK